MWWQLKQYHCSLMILKAVLDKVVIVMLYIEDILWLSLVRLHYFSLTLSLSIVKNGDDTIAFTLAATGRARASIAALLFR